MTFVCEDDLVICFSRILESKRTALPRMEVCFEFTYLGGKTDIIGVTGNGTLHSFEVKLDRWKDCLNQAYRSTSFSHYSYVLLPDVTVGNALREEEQFRKRAVGLCSYGNGAIRLHIRPVRREPLQPWITERAVASIRGDSDNGG